MPTPWPGGDPPPGRAGQRGMEMCTRYTFLTVRRYTLKDRLRPDHQIQNHKEEKYLMRQKGAPPGLRLIALLLIIGLFPLDAAASQEKPLILGFFPIVSTVALYKRFTPLVGYLSDRLGRPVRLLTAKDFPTFAQRTAARRYDIVVTAPHFAVRAADSGRYQIRAASVKPVQQLFVVRADSPIRSLEQLAGVRIATPPKPALMTLMGKDLLRQAGLSDDRAPVYHAFTSHNAANQALLAGEVDAAIASSNIIGKALQRGEPLRILGEGLKLPNMPTLVATDLPKALAERVEQILLEMQQTTAGQRVLKQIGFPGYRAVTLADYEPVRPYAYRNRPKTAAP